MNDIRQDTIIDDKDLDAFIYDMSQKYKGKLKSLNMDHREDLNGIQYLNLISIKIHKKSQGHGVGKEVMLDIIDYADNYNIPVKLWATDVFGSNLERLINFYRGFGFKLVDKNDNMIYIPSKQIK